MTGHEIENKRSTKPKKQECHDNKSKQCLSVFCHDKGIVLFECIK